MSENNNENITGNELTIVVPVYNSEEILPILVERIHTVMLEQGYDYELVLVNDGSQDGSWPVIQGLMHQHPWITGINLMKNYGQHNALLCGIRAASKPVIVTMDDDLQHPPEEIPRLLEELGSGCDVVYGSAISRKHSLFRNIASYITRMALKGAMGVHIAEHVGAFRAFHTKLRNAFSDYNGTFVSIDVLLTWATTRFAVVTVRHDPRYCGESQYTLRKLITLALNMMTGFGTLPLQIATLVGLIFTLFGFLVLLYVLLRWFIHGSTMPGFPFLASIIAIFSGAQLFALGIIGEYLARMHYRLMDRPAYVEDEELPKKNRGSQGE